MFRKVAVGMAGAVAVAATLVLGAAPEQAVAGPDGPTTLWARVEANGTILAASGLRSGDHARVGHYNLHTDVDITSCALTGTVNAPTDNTSRTSIKVSGTGSSVRVITATSSVGTFVNVPFSLAIFCG